MGTPTEAGRHRYRKQLTSTDTKWIAIPGGGAPTGLEDRDGANLAGFMAYVYIPVPSSDGAVIRLHVNTDAVIDFELLDYPGHVPYQDGPNSIVLLTAIAIPGEHYTAGGAGALPSSYALDSGSDLHFSANIVTARLNGVAAANVTFTAVFQPYQ